MSAKIATITLANFVPSDKSSNIETQVSRARREVQADGLVGSVKNWGNYKTGQLRSIPEVKSLRSGSSTGIVSRLSNKEKVISVSTVAAVTAALSALAVLL